MAIPKFHHQPMSWGATQANGEYDSTLLTLAATGAGVWAVIDGHEVTRQGALAIDTETEVGFYVHARVAQWSSGNLTFRLYNVTGAVVLLTAPWTWGGDYFAYDDTLDNALPAGNARLQLQYNLIAPTTCRFYNAMLDFYKWQ